MRTILGLIHIPKTGGTTVAMALRQGNFMVVNNHQRATLRRQQDRDWSRSFHATFIRNPWDRAVSFFYWNKEHHPDLSFDEWVKSGCPNLHSDFDTNGEFDNIDQLAYFTDDNGKDLVGFVGRYENLEEDTIRLAEYCKITSKPIGHWSASSRPKGPYQQFYTPETARLLANHTETFIERFDYKFE